MSSGQEARVGQGGRSGAEALETPAAWGDTDGAGAAGALGRTPELEDAATREALRVLSAHRNLTQRLCAEWDSPGALGCCLRAALGVANASQGALYLTEPGTGDLTLAEAEGVTAEQRAMMATLPAGSPQARLAKAGSPLFTDLRDHELFFPAGCAGGTEPAGSGKAAGPAEPSPQHGLAFTATAVLPLAHGDVVLGVLVLAVPALGDLTALIQRGLEAVSDVTTAVLGRRLDRERQRRAELDLEASRLESAAILDAIGLGVVLLNDRREVIGLNALARSWFPYVDPGVRPRADEAFYDPSGSEPPPESLAREVLTDGRSHERVWDRAFDGTHKTLRVIASPVRNADGEVTAVVETIDDVSEQLSLEEQLRQSQKLEAVGTLAAGVAHDVNNILATIMAVATYAHLSEVSPSEHAEAMEEILSACRRGASLTSSLLGFTRKQGMTRERLPVATIVNRVAGILERTIAKGIETRVELGGGRAGDGDDTGDIGEIEVDLGPMQQALLNLCLNAVDAMEGHGVLTIGARCLEITPETTGFHRSVPPGRYACLTVADTGCGMSAAVLAKALEPFFTTKPAGSGTGLGLTMVQRIVEKHGGAIAITSRPGQGTEVRLALPSVAAPSGFSGSGAPLDPTRAAASRRAKTSPTVRTGTVLLVDDEDPVRTASRRILELLGYRVLTAGGGRRAVELYREHQGRLAFVLLDLLMPEMDGEATLREILAVDPRARVLIMSGHAREGIVGQLHELGAKGFLPKPFGVNELEESLSQVLEHG